MPATAGTTGTALAGLGWLSAAGTFLQMWGYREAGRMARIQGERARVAAEFQAWQAERQAGVAISISQRQAIEERRQADLVASRALAVAASSGGGVSDPTVVKLISNARGEGAYRANVALYEGEAKARSLRMEALTGRAAGFDAEAEGAAREGAYAIAGLGKLAKDASSLYAKYGLNGPGTSPHEGALDQYQLFSGEGMIDPRFG